MLPRSVMSNSLRPRGLQPSRLCCPWEFSRQECWSGLPCPPPGDLCNPGIEPRSPTLQADSSPSEPPGKPIRCNELILGGHMNVCSWSPGASVKQCSFLDVFLDVCLANRVSDDDSFWKKESSFSALCPFFLWLCTQQKRGWSIFLHSRVVSVFTGINIIVNERRRVRLRSWSSV